MSRKYRKKQRHAGPYYEARDGFSSFSATLNLDIIVIAIDCNYTSFFAPPDYTAERLIDENFKLVPMSKVK